MKQKLEVSTGITARMHISKVFSVVVDKVSVSLVPAVNCSRYLPSCLFLQQQAYIIVLARMIYISVSLSITYR